MSFFGRLINKIRGINEQSRIQKQHQLYIYGVILSGSYTNWKTDPHPTFFCLGTYNKLGSMYVHGIQMHELGENLQWFLNLLISFKSNNTVTNPYYFFTYLKLNAPHIITKCYRTYKIEYCNFKIVNPGLTNIKNFYKPEDSRDYFLEQLTPYIHRKFIDIEALRNNITNVLNTIKIW